MLTSFDPQPNSGHQPSTLFSTAPVEVLRQAFEPAEVWFCEGEDNLAVQQLGVYRTVYRIS